MAREKNTSRSEARRRTRETLRAERLTDLPPDEVVVAEGDVAPVDTAAAPQPRPKLFNPPNFRADLRSLPQMFRTRRLLWAPLILLLLGAVLTIVSPGLAPEAQSLVVLFVQFFFIPPALFTFFVAGFLAPRASYLVGMLYGLIAGIAWFVALVPSDLVSNTSELFSTLGIFLFNGLIYGTLAAAFAGWYRDFLRGMQDRGRNRRAEQESKLRSQRREDRQEARRVAKRST